MFSSFFRLHISVLSIFLFTLIPNRVLAQNALDEISFASFNLAFAATESEYKQVLRVCESIDWCNPRLPTSYISIKKIEDAELCSKRTKEAWGSEEVAKNSPPCNAYDYAKNEKIITLQKKNKFLGETITQLTTKAVHHPSVKVIAFQEVSSAQAAKEIVGENLSKDYYFCDSGEHDGVQKLVFMWHKSLGENECETYSKLGVADGSRNDGSRNLRPGLRLTLNINKQPISFLNIHLKASCASVFPDDSFAGRVLTDQKDENCKTLLSQMPPLLEWLEETNRKSPHFILLGDFNRKIDHEKSAVDLKLIGKEEKQVAEIKIDKDELLGKEELVKRIKYPRFMWTYLSNKLKDLQQLELSQPNSADCSGFSGLDHVVISSALHKVQAKPTSSFKTAVEGKLIAENVKASDHCPRVSTVTLPK